MKPKKILLAEDNPDDEVLTIRALKSCGVYNEVIVVHDGQEAINYLEGSHEHADRDESEIPQLVLLDLKMPRLDGMDVLEWIRKHPKFNLLPVVILTSSREESDLLKSYELGVNSFVCKPIDFKEFSDCIRQLGLYWLLINELPEV